MTELPTELPTDETGWRRWIEFDLDHAVRVLVGPTDQLLPLYVLFTADGERHVFAIPTTSEKEAEAAQHWLMIAAIALDAWGVTHVAEAWGRAITQRPYETRKATLRRADEMMDHVAEPTPDRQEYVVATAAWRDRDYHRSGIAGSREIKRDPDGTPHLGPVRWLPVNVAGPPELILPSSQPPAAVVAHAKQVFQRVVAASDAATRH